MDLINEIKSRINITDYLTAAGYHLERHGSNGRLRLKEHDSFIIDPTKNRFWWNSRDLHGSIIDLVAALEGIDESEAIKRLAKHLHQPIRAASSHAHNAAMLPPIKPPPFHLPEPVPKYWSRVYGYLIKERGIDPTVVKWLEKSGIIYPTEHANLCYISRNPLGDADYAALKGTGTGNHFRKVVEGGNYDARAAFNLYDSDRPCSGWFVCEAAVDCFSIMALLHSAGRDWRQYAYISLESCHPAPLVYHLRHNPAPPYIWLAQDNDAAGNKSRADSRALLNQLGFSGTVLDKIPTLGKDWNDTLKYKNGASIKTICEDAKEKATHINADKATAAPIQEQTVNQNL